MKYTKTGFGLKDIAVVAKLIKDKKGFRGFLIFLSAMANIYYLLHMIKFHELYPKFQVLIGKLIAYLGGFIY